MKTQILNMIFLQGVLLGLVSCGSGGTTSTSLEVSRAFAVTNTGFDGGLIISGKNVSTGRSFTQSLTTNNSIRFNLEPGDWVFSAVGWDGEKISPDGTRKFFAGKPYCGYKTQNLSGSSATVSLSVTQSECGSASFAGSYPDTTTNAAIPTLPKLKLINTCKSFFTSVPAETGTATPSSVMVNPYTAVNYCDDASFPADWKTKVGSIRIHAVNKAPGQLIPDIGFYSECIKQSISSPSKIDPYSVTGPGNPFNGFDLRLPMRNVPLIISTFEENNCTKPIAKLDFIDGLEPSYTNFDHILSRYQSSLTEVRLFLPSGDLKRALTPFAHVLPYFKKSDGSRFITEPLSSNTNYHLYVGHPSEIFLDRDNCTGVTWDTNINTSTCTVVDGKAKLNVIASNSGPQSVVFSSPAETIYFYIDPAANRKRHETNAVIWKLLGPTDPQTGNYKNYFLGNEDEESDYGVLSRVREMLSGNGASGALGLVDPSQTFYNNCLQTVNDKTISVFNNEEMREETYRVKVHNTITSTPGPFTCLTSNIDSSCIGGNTYNKRMIIWDYQKDRINPYMVMEFSCDEMIGKLESRVSEVKYTEIHEIHSKIEWNTSSASSNLKQRFDFLEWMSRKDSANDVLDEKRSMSKIVKNTADEYAVWNYNFFSHWNGSDYDESLEKNEMKSDTTNLQFRQSITSWAGNYKDIFATPDTGVNTVRSETPYASVLQDQYQVNASFPQGLSTGSYTSLPSVPSTNGGDDIQGLDRKLESLDGDFETKFGSSFYIAP